MTDDDKVVNEKVLNVTYLVLMCKRLETELKYLKGRDYLNPARNECQRESLTRARSALEGMSQILEEYGF